MCEPRRISIINQCFDEHCSCHRQHSTRLTLESRSYALNPQPKDKKVPLIFDVGEWSALGPDFFTKGKETSVGPGAGSEETNFTPTRSDVVCVYVQCGRNGDRKWNFYWFI